MSAYMVSKEHIDLMVTAALAWEQAVPEQATDIGRMLWRENLASITWLYPDAKDGDWPGPIDFVEADVEGYTFEAYPGRVDPEIVATAAGSWFYQSCEHPGFADLDCEARHWVMALTSTADDMVPGYRDHYGQADHELLCQRDTVGRDVFINAAASRARVSA